MDKKQVKKEIKKLSLLKGYNIKNIVEATKQMERIKFSFKGFSKAANKIGQIGVSLKKIAEAVKVTARYSNNNPPDHKHD